MNTPTLKLNPSASLENIASSMSHAGSAIDLEQRLEKKLNVVYCLKNSIKNIKKMINFLKNKNRQSKKKQKNYKTLTFNNRIRRYSCQYFCNRKL